MKADKNKQNSANNKTEAKKNTTTKKKDKKEDKITPRTIQIYSKTASDKQNSGNHLMAESVTKKCRTL